MNAKLDYFLFSLIIIVGLSQHSLAASKNHNKYFTRIDVQSFDQAISQIENLLKRKSEHMVCAYVDSQLVILCGSVTNEQMLQSFLRMHSLSFADCEKSNSCDTSFIPGGMRPNDFAEKWRNKQNKLGTTIKKDNRGQKTISIAARSISGLNTSGTSFLNLLSHVNSLCPTQRKYCLNKYEQAFSDHFDQAILISGVSIITFAQKTMKSPRIKGAKMKRTKDYNYRSTISHELLHEQYKRNVKFKETVEAYWNTHLNNMERSTLLRVFNYSTHSGPHLINAKNEFQAHTLQYDNSDMKRSSERLAQVLIIRNSHHNRLVQALDEAGVELSYYER